MKTFIGTKIINAKPMTRLDYNLLRNWTLPADEDGSDPGYLVEYLDGGTPNLVGFAGYVSWSPKEQFDAGYVQIPDVGEQPAWFVRVLGEMAQLMDRIGKLKGFLANETLPRINDDEHRDLMSQLETMKVYAGVLKSRIERQLKG